MSNHEVCPVALGARSSDPHSHLDMTSLAVSFLLHVEIMGALDINPTTIR